MYVKFEYWARIGDDAVIRYQGIQNTANQNYAIINGYRFYDPVDGKYVVNSDKIFVELLTAMMIEGTIQWGSSFQQALENYNREFSISGVVIE